MSGRKKIREASGRMEIGTAIKFSHRRRASIKSAVFASISGPLECCASAATLQRFVQLGEVFPAAGVFSDNINVSNPELSPTLKIFCTETGLGFSTLSDVTRGSAVAVSRTSCHAFCLDGGIVGGPGSSNLATCFFFLH